MKITRREAIVGGAILAAATATPAVARKSASVLDEHDALGLAGLVKTKQVSAKELLDLAIARTEALNPRYNFISQNHFDLARTTVAKGVPDGPFAGVPWLIKDLNTYIAGQVTQNGSRIYRDFRPNYTSELVKRHERAGLVIFGKTTTPEFGLTGTTESVVTGATRNPWNIEHSSGGSSGGSAVAVALGVIPAAHATDGGGSIRIPASACGLFGLKPSRGRVPMGPPRTEGWGGMSCHHEITRTVRDSAALLDATHGPELGARYSAPTPERPYLEEVTREPGRLRIALMLTPPSNTPVAPECIEAARNAAKLCESLGHIVEEAAPKLDAAALGMASFVMTGASVAADLEDRAKALGVPLSLDLVEPVTMMFRDVGAKFQATDWVRANIAFQDAARTLAEFMQNYDVILTPTLAETPQKLGALSLSQEVQTYLRNVTPYSPFAALFNQTGQPSMSVPLAMSKSGLPIGVMFSGRYGDEATLFRLAGQLERAAPWAQRRPVVK